MPVLDLSQLSSNWKQLQATLIPNKKQDKPSTGLKRKRNEQHGVSKTSTSSRLGGRESAVAVKRRRMGNRLSAAAPAAADASHSKLAEQHDIAPEDISAAYGSRERIHKDVVNCGLHPTHKMGRYVGLDCEMVGTGPPPHADNVLARVSAVNYHGEQIYDSYVLPPPGIQVEDYRTFVSGIKPGHLREGVARPFAEVQKDVAELLHGRLLVGHALRNDFQVLLLSHPKRDVRDTSKHPKYRERTMGRPPALRQLAEDELGLAIQTGEHSSLEDARAAMMLFRKEKAGFEAENVKRFGRASKFVNTKAKSSKVMAANDAEGGEDGAADAKLLGEEDDVGTDLDDVASGHGNTNSNGSTATAKKKRKKKKRTKR